MQSVDQVRQALAELRAILGGDDYWVFVTDDPACGRCLVVFAAAAAKREVPQCGLIVTRFRNANGDHVTIGFLCLEKKHWNRGKVVRLLRKITGAKPTRVAPKSDHYTLGDNHESLCLCIDDILYAQVGVGPPAEIN